MNKIAIVFVVFLILIVGWYFYRHSTGQKDYLYLEKPQFSENEFNYSINLNKNTNSSIDLIVSEIPIKDKPKDRTVYYYSDSKYPVLGTSTNSILGVYEHLLAEYQKKNISGRIQKVDSLQLLEALNDKDGIIVMASGVLPDTVYSLDTNLITPWIRNGGTFVWIGDALGYYYGVSGAEIKSADSEYKIGWSGQERILAENFLSGEYLPAVSDSAGDYPSSIAVALGIRSNYTQTGAFVSSIGNSNDNDLGYHYNFTSDARTSLSQIKIGKGSAFIFGSFLLNREVGFAWDISQIIASGFIDADVNKISFKKISIVSGDQEKIERNINIGNNNQVRVLIFSTDPTQNYFRSKDFRRE